MPINYFGNIDLGVENEENYQLYKSLIGEDFTADRLAIGNNSSYLYRVLAHFVGKGIFYQLSHQIRPLNVLFC